MGLNLCDRCVADCRHHREPNEIVVKCGAFKAPETNTDHIRSMSDEELAEFINCCTSGDGAPDFCRRLPECDDDLEADTLIPLERCKQCLLYWLRQPAAEFWVSQEDARTLEAGGGHGG